MFYLHTYSCSSRFLTTLLMKMSDEVSEVSFKIKLYRTRNFISFSRFSLSFKLWMLIIPYSLMACITWILNFLFLPSFRIYRCFVRNVVKHFIFYFWKKKKREVLCLRNTAKKILPVYFKIIRCILVFVYICK